MAVAALGSSDRKGRIYLYQYDTTGTFEVSNITIVDGGTGYSDGNTLTLTVGGRSATFIASTLNGAVTSLTILDPGKFITTTSATQSTSVFPSGGIGCTISVSFALAQNIGWSHLENQSYTGIYNADEYYSKGTIVWYNSALYEATQDTLGDGSSGIVNSESWKQLNDVVTHNSLPGGPATIDDGSTLDLGLLSDQELAELVKAGDEFGHSMAMNGDGSILVVGAPLSDGQYFDNFRGLYNSYQEYKESDVVKYRAIPIQKTVSKVTLATFDPTIPAEAAKELSDIFKKQVEFILTNLSSWRKLFANIAVHIAAHGSSGLNNCGGLNRCYFGFQRRNQFAKFGFNRFNGGGDFCFNSGNAFALLGFDSIQFFNDCL
jgi:hypothetical protein